MGASVVLEQVLVLFIVLGVGVLARKGKILSDAAITGMSTLVLTITSPALIIGAFQFEYTPEMALMMVLMAVGAILTHIVLLLIGKPLYQRRPPNERAVLWFSLVFSNAGFMGFPVLEGLLGKPGVLLGSVYVAVFNLFAYTAGMGMFTGKARAKDALKILVNPGVLCIFVGLFLFLTGIRLPGVLQRSLSMVGGLTTPLAMLVVGARLGDIQLRDAFRGNAWFYFTAALRLVGVPLITLLVCRALQLPAMTTTVLTLQTGMPAAAMTSLFAEQYEGDRACASRMVFITTMFSVVSIPLIAALTM